MMPASFNKDQIKYHVDYMLAKQACRAYNYEYYVGQGVAFADPVVAWGSVPHVSTDDNVCGQSDSNCAPPY